jgi:hypothetical protein
MPRRPNRKQRREMLDDVIAYARKTRAATRRAGGGGGLWQGIVKQIAKLMGYGTRPNSRQTEQAAEILKEAGYEPSPSGGVVIPGPAPKVVTTPEEWPAEHGITLAPRGWSDIAPGQPKTGYNEVFTVGSSNVYSYRFVPETPTMGILYVTFQLWIPGQKGKKYSEGPTYAYYDVPLSKYLAFSRNPSAGKAVWDYLRLRGTVHGHQQPYRLVRGAVGRNILGPGRHEYVPRKATAKAMRVRTVPTVGLGRFGVGTRSQLPERRFSTRRGK